MSDDLIEQLDSVVEFSSDEENMYRNPVAVCANCKFFYAKVVRGADASECRKNPPGLDGSFPKTKCDYWCGSHPLI